MAKKARTPTPPRKVQAPQRRSDPKRPRSPEDRRFLILSMAFAASGLVAVAIAALFFFVFSGNDKAAGKIPDDSNLIGLQTGPAPWNPGLDTLPDRLAPLGLNDLTTEGQVTHIHQHLDIFVNGKKEPVPAGIGIYDGQFLTELHTHDSSGIMHVESPTKRTFDLAQFFGVWGVRLTPSCVGGYCKELTPLAPLRQRSPVPGRPAHAQAQGAPGDRVRDRHAAGEDPLELQVRPRGLGSVRLFFAAPGWRNWSYAPDLKSGVPSRGREGSTPSPGIEPRGLCS